MPDTSKRTGAFATMLVSTKTKVGVRRAFILASVACLSL